MAQTTINFAFMGFAGLNLSKNLNFALNFWENLSVKAKFRANSSAKLGAKVKLLKQRKIQ